MDQKQVDELMTGLADYYENVIPFNTVLGIRMERFSLDGAVVGFDMRDDLVGNTKKGILHGGVISSVLDFTGGAIAQISMLKEMLDDPVEAFLERVVHLGTIDLRVDYIRPGTGTRFFATGETLRMGRRVAVVRSELRNDEERLIAAGTGSYTVG